MNTEKKQQLYNLSLIFTTFGCVSETPEIMVVMRYLVFNKKRNRNNLSKKIYILRCENGTMVWPTVN